MRLAHNSTGPGNAASSARLRFRVLVFPGGFCAAASRATAERATRSGASADPLTLQFPNASDGLRGIEFIDAVVRSSQANGAWTAPG